MGLIWSNVRLFIEELQSIWATMCCVLAGMRVKTVAKEIQVPNCFNQFPNLEFTTTVSDQFCPFPEQVAHWCWTRHFLTWVINSKTIQISHHFNSSRLLFVMFQLASFRLAHQIGLYWFYHPFLCRTHRNFDNNCLLFIFIISGTSGIPGEKTFI